MRSRLLVLALGLGLAGSLGLTGAAAIPPAPIFGPPLVLDAQGPVSIGDLDGDGKLDHVSPAVAQSAIAVSPGNGDGTFGFMRQYVAGTAGGAVALGDLNDDGITDLAVTNPFEDAVRVLPGPLPEPSPPGVPEDVPGTVLYPAGDFPRALAVADLEVAGTLDLVVGTTGVDPADPTDDAVAVLLANGSGGFRPPVHYTTWDVAALAIGDVDDSGDPDIVVANYEANTISVLLGNSNGTFGSRTPFSDAVLFQPRALALGDVNGDGRLDVVVGQQGHGVDIFIGSGSGLFTAQPSAAVALDPLTDVMSVAIADLNFDGNPELVVGTGVTSGAPDPPRVVVLTGHGDGTFDDPVDYASASDALVAIADLNADGKLDLAASGGPWVRLNELASNTPGGSSITVVPVDPTTGDTPATITFANVTLPGETRVTSASTGPGVPGVFTLASAYYELTTTAVFDSAEVCFRYSGFPAPSILHWVGGVPLLEPTTRDTGTHVCAIVTSFSPFALVLPAGGADTASPVVACGSGDGAWHGANVSIQCTAQDAGSGLADPADAAFSLSTAVAAGAEDADAATGTRQVCDAAGNCATAGPIAGNKVDRKAPALSLPAARTVDATSPSGAAVTYLASATDDAHPSPTVSCAPDPSVFGIGTTTVACSATDHVGNTAGGSFTVTVRGAKEQLARLVNDVVAASGLPAAVKTQLLARIQPLLAGFDPANAAQRRAVCTGLSLFTAALRLLSGHGVPPAQAAAWTADANRIRAVLGC